MKSKIKVVSLAEVYVNDELLFRSKNKWTRYFMSTMIISIGGIESNPGTHSSRTYIMGNYWDARVGTDTSTPTEPTMSDLVSKVDTPPDSKVRRLIYSSSEGLYITEFVFSWNAGTLPDMTIGEFGVYLYLGDDSWSSPMLNPHTGEGIYDPYGNSSKRLASRIASADGSFDAFEFCGSIDPLTFKWRFQVAIT